VTARFKTIVCPIHATVKVGLIELEPDSTKAFIVWTRTPAGPEAVMGGRAAEERNKTRLRFDDERVVRGAIPFVVTWCKKCSREYVLQMTWLLEESKSGGLVQCPRGVLPSSQQEKS
jgi:hypothetical protein